jgi:hypothetical protein
MKIEDIMEHWKNDARIDEINLDTASLDIPNLHAKWLQVRTKAKGKLYSLETKRKRLTKTLHEYYRGNLNNPEDLAEIGRQPLLSKPLNSETSMYVDADDEMIDINLRISAQREVVEVLDEIMKSLNNRNWVIRNAIEYRKLTHT